MARDRALRLGVLGAGLLVIVAARLVLPTAPPLYDGIIPITPYLWLDPPAGQPGGAKGATADIAVRNGKSPLVAVATPELEPQAQIFAPPDGLTIPSGAHRIKVSVEPVPSEGAPTNGHIDGNVYRISVLDDTGVALTAPASARVSVVLRATDPAQGVATIARLSGGSWQPLKTSASGFGGSFLSVVTEFGDFAVILPGPGPSVAATEAPAPSAGASVVASGLSVASTGPSPGSIAPTSSSDTSGLPGWLFVALAVFAVVLAIVGYRVARRPRRRRHQGAHRIRWD
jgi:hypothetical protein